MLVCHPYQRMHFRIKNKFSCHDVYKLSCAKNACITEQEQIWERINLSTSVIKQGLLLLVIRQLSVPTHALAPGWYKIMQYCKLHLVKLHSFTLPLAHVWEIVAEWKEQSTIIDFFFLFFYELVCSCSPVHLWIYVVFVSSLFIQ